ncbi:MAG: hypothetical protein NTZ16_12550 [Verrucomicrobia bacterium]|nr:hypothetical protein [Verrucomicrobiota bacterium]
MRLLEAIAPATTLFCVGYAWQDGNFGELTGHTVVDACDAETALRRFRNQNRHVTKAWIIEDES